jgi:hypothetical protein
MKKHYPPTLVIFDDAGQCILRIQEPEKNWVRSTQSLKQGIYRIKNFTPTGILMQTFVKK